MNPLQGVGELGQSVWLDYIRRNLIASGELQRMINEDGLRGITSNPAIFEKAITGSTDYKDALELLGAQRGLDAKAIYERLAIEDIQQAADMLQSVYAATRRRDGYVSLEVSPKLARDTEGTIREAHRLWKALGRENLMIKVPATPEGISAIDRLISEGINVNATLIFSQAVYEKVAQAYLAGIERFAERESDLGRVASVASFFISRIDAAVDKVIDERFRAARTAEERSCLRRLRGRVAVANAKLAYERYKKLFSGRRWSALERRGAQTQRLLWASTGTKNPKYSDVLYVQELIGPDTVNTIPPATYDAFRDHGKAQKTLEEDCKAAREIVLLAEQRGIPMREITEELLKDGLRLFEEAFEKLLCGIDAVRGATAGGLVGRQTYQLPMELAKELEETLKDWQARGKAPRLWARDASLWTGADEGKWLGWLGIAQQQLERVEHLQTIAEAVKSGGFSHIVLLGMGGSSLAPDVLARTFGRLEGFPKLHVLDSTDPAQIKALESTIDLRSSLFIVSSKSGTTLEPNIFKQYFFERVRKTIGAEEASRRFIAITDPDSKLQDVAERDGFRDVFFGVPSIGGRYSALSDFGMVPAAAMGLDVASFLDRAEEMVQACSGCVPATDNPGVVLGAILGVLGKRGRDKVTLITSPRLRGLGAWLEQLLAESTGKQGKGLIPVDQEKTASPEVYGCDRLFVYLRLETAPDAHQEAAVTALEQTGAPLVRIAVSDPYALGQEFFRWEFATTVAGSILGINPFDQPDVEVSKLAARALMADFEAARSFPSQHPILEEDGLSLFSDERNTRELSEAIIGEPTLTKYLAAHVNRLQPGDYFALLGYLDSNEAHDYLLQLIRHAIRDAKRVATCLGYGPRFLHSTGQVYKGGPNTGVFIQLTCDDAADVAVPGQRYTFGAVKTAQARGDIQVLSERNRRVLRVHLGADVGDGLRKLNDMMRRVLSHEASIYGAQHT